MSRFIVFLLVSTIVRADPTLLTFTTENPEIDKNIRAGANDLEIDKIKINGKTYFFQLRKDENGNETIYKKVRDEKNEGLGDQIATDFIAEDENPKGKFSPFESLKNRRRDFLVSCYKLNNFNRYCVRILKNSFCIS